MGRLSVALILLLPPAALAQDEWTGAPPPRLVGGHVQTVAAPEVEPQPESKADPKPAESDMPAWLWLAIGLGLGLGVLGVYKFVVEPRRKRRPLLAALELLARDEADLYPEAERLLTDVLTVGLGRRDVVTARFHLAYVRSQLGRYPEAAAILSDVPPSARDREIVYLDLWLQHRLKAHERVEAIYRDSAAVVGDLYDTKLIVGIAYLHRARMFWSAKQISAAVDYFNKLRALNVPALADEIPEHIDDHQIVLGVAAVFEGDFTGAAKHFRGAVASAAAAGKSTTAARLGELLCEWRSQDSPAIDDPLGVVAADLEAPAGGAIGKVNCAQKACGHEFVVSVLSAGKRATCTTCGRGFRLPPTVTPIPPDQPTDVPPDRLLSDDELLARNVFLWHAVSHLIGWRGLEPQGGLSDAQAEVLWERLAKVRATDPGMADPDLIEGLIRYYFAPDDDARRKAVALLERAAEAGMNVPAVRELLDRETRLAEHQADSLLRFFGHVQNYVGDGKVRLEFRQDLWSRLNRSSRFSEVPEPDGSPEGESAPSLEELHDRSRILRERVNRVHTQIAHADPASDQAKAISGLIEKLDQNTESLAQSAREVEQVEHDLLASTSEYLLKEDQDNEPEATP